MTATASSSTFGPGSATSRRRRVASRFGGDGGMNRSRASYAAVSRLGGCLFIYEAQSNFISIPHPVLPFPHSVLVAADPNFGGKSVAERAAAPDEAKLFARIDYSLANSHLLVETSSATRTWASRPGPPNEKSFFDSTRFGNERCVVFPSIE